MIYATLVTIPYRSCHRLRALDREGSLLTDSTRPTLLRLASPVLWATWGLALLAMALFALATWSSRERSLIAQRAEQLRGVASDLEQAFAGLERLPEIAVREARSLASQKELSDTSLERLQQNLQPFGRLTYLDAKGEPKWAGPQQTTAPAWLATLARRREASAQTDIWTLRPLPPGLEAGKADLRLEPETPPLYLASVGRVPGGGLLIAQLDLDYIFGSWLKKRLERSSLGDDLSALPLSDSQDLPSAQEQQAISVATFFAEDTFAFPYLRLQLDNATVLSDERRWVLGGALLGGISMVALALFLAGTLRAMRAELAYSEARTRFSNMVGHELRTPISGISMYAEILREGLVEDPEKLANYHRLLKSQIERLQGLVDRVLTFARLESETAAAGPLVEVKLLELAQKASSAVATLGHPMQLIIPEELVVNTEPDTAVQILANLLENAIKHSASEDPVEVTARRLESRGAVELLVLDRGPGVPAEMREAIFLPYKSILAQERITGLGLGLAVARGLARSLDGQVECRERPGGGSIFALILPGQQRSAS